MGDTASQSGLMNVVCGGVQNKRPGSSGVFIVCGACKVGQLIPLFNTRVPKTPRSKISSRLAAERGLGQSCLPSLLSMRANYLI